MRNKHYISDSQSISKEQYESIAVLSVGTFLEYFDLKLYIHMAVILNAVFFPPTDPNAGYLLSAFAFCSTFLFRPLGALIFGYLGDKIGRRSTVFITTSIMGFTCMVMYLLPTYQQIGIWASIIVTVCRVLQGMSSLGEVIGARLYVTESIKPPKVYPLCLVITLFAVLGGSAAIAVAKFAIDYTFNWRNVFLIGVVVAFVGTICRTTLRESTEFVDANKRLPKDQRINRPLNKKLILSLFFMDCLYPLSIYVAFVYCPMVLKRQGLEISEIFSRNLYITFIDILFGLVMMAASYKFNPFKIIRFLTYLYIPSMVMLLFLLHNNVSPGMIFILQVVILCLTPNVVPASPKLYKAFPVFKRFRIVSMMYALASAAMYLFTSFGVGILIEKYTFFGLIIVLLPLITAYVWGLNNFIKIEKRKGNYTLFHK